MSDPVESRFDRRAPPQGPENQSVPEGSVFGTILVIVVGWLVINAVGIGYLLGRWMAT